jgi:AraC-like DNA-binding protein
MQFRPTIPGDAMTPAAPAVVDLSFAECDQFAEAIRHEGVEMVQTMAGRFANQVRLIPLNQTLMRYGVHQGPFVCSGTALSGHVSVVLDPVSQGPTTQNGEAIYEAQALGMYGSRAEHFSRSSPGEYFYVPFPEAQFHAAWHAAMGGDDAIGPAQFRRVRPEGRRWQALLDTIAAIRNQAAAAPESFCDPRMRAAVERSLLSAIVLAIAADQARIPPVATRLAARERPAVVRRMLDYLRAHAHEPVYVLDLCAATGVSERPLRDAFLEYFGMGPMRYLKLRRLHHARRTLREGNADSVKAVALENGFWELGRFAVQYRQLFGEPPSETLRRGRVSYAPC